MTQAPVISADLETMEPPWSPKYCDRCGSRLIERVEHTGRYNSYNGANIVRVIMTCPHKRWWNRHGTRSLIWMVSDSTATMEL